MIYGNVVRLVLFELGFWAIIVAVVFLIAFIPVSRKRPKKCIVPDSFADCARGPNDKCPYLKGLPFGGQEEDK